VDLPPLPEALLTDDGRPIRPYNPRRHLLKGLVWLFSGIGLGIALWPTRHHDYTLFSLIPIGIGLAHLIYYFVEGRKEAAEADRRRSEPPFVAPAGS